MRRNTKRDTEPGQASLPLKLNAPMALYELRRAANAAFGADGGDRLMRVLEVHVVAAAQALVGARYRTFVQALADAMPQGTPDVNDWLGELEDEALLRTRIAAVELAVGPILGGRLDDGFFDYEAQAILASDIEDAIKLRDHEAAKSR